MMDQLARADFERATRKAFWNHVVSWFTGKNNELLPFDEVQMRLPIAGQHYRGMVEVPVERAGKIVSKAIELGVSRVTNFSLTATDEATAAAQREALKLAAKRARADADAVLEALGYTATGVVKIHVSGSAPGPMGRGMAAMAYSAKSAPALEGGVEDITGSVTLEVSY